MANKQRGEVDLLIGGKAHPVALNMDAIGRIAEALGVDTIEDLEKRITALKISDVQPVLAALCAANGITLSAADLKQMHFKTYISTMMQLWNAKPESDDAGEGAAATPRKRAA
jgi:hypothetical protein